MSRQHAVSDVDHIPAAVGEQAHYWRVIDEATRIATTPSTTVSAA